MQVDVTLPSRNWRQGANSSGATRSSDLQMLIDNVRSSYMQPSPPFSRLYISGSQGAAAKSVCGDGLCSPDEVQLDGYQRRYGNQGDASSSCDADCRPMAGFCTQRPLHELPWPTQPRSFSHNPHSIYWLPRRTDTAQVRRILISHLQA